MAKRSNSGRKVYWDAGVFLSLIEGEPPHRMQVLTSILDEVEKEDVLLYTSLISITEVAFGKAERDGKALDAATEEKIERFWSPPTPIRLVTE